MRLSQKSICASTSEGVTRPGRLKDLHEMCSDLDRHPACSGDLCVVLDDTDYMCIYTDLLNRASMELNPNVTSQRIVKSE